LAATETGGVLEACVGFPGKAALLGRTSRQDLRISHALLNCQGKPLPAEVMVDNKRRAPARSRAAQVHGLAPDADARGFVQKDSGRAFPIDGVSFVSGDLWQQAF